MQKQIGHLAGEDILSNTALQSAHIGISVFDPANNQYLYNYQGDKYFVPASNTKLFSLYAGMKYLGDSLTGIRYMEQILLFLYCLQVTRPYCIPITRSSP